MATLAQPLAASKPTAAISAPVVLTGRILFALIFLMAAPNHFAGGTIAYATSQGVPLASIAVPLSGVLAILGGLSILLASAPKSVGGSSRSSCSGLRRCTISGQSPTP